MEELIYPDMAKPIYALRGEMFDHLSETDYINLFHRYYVGQKSKELMEEYGVVGSPQKFTANLPYFEREGDVCRHCSINMVSKGDTSNKDGKIYGLWLCECPECGHKSNARIEGYKCKCDNCQEEFLEILNENISESIEHAKSIDDYRTAPMHIKLMLAAILRSGQDEHDLELIHPAFLDKKTKLAPTSDMGADIVSSLKSMNWLRFDEKNSEDVFTIKDGSITSYGAFKVRYRLNLEDSFNAIGELSSPNLDEFEIGMAEQYWLLMAQGECIEYLKYQLKEHNLPIDVGPKTVSVINEALKHYSTSQVFSLIWPSVRDAAAFYQKDRITKQHAVNTIAGSMQRKLEKALSGGWEVKGYRRDFNLPQSLIASLLSSRVFKNENKMFDEVIPERAFKDKKES